MVFLLTHAGIKSLHGRHSEEESGGENIKKVAAHERRISGINEAHGMLLIALHLLQLATKNEQG